MASNLGKSGRVKRALGRLVIILVVAFGLLVAVQVFSSGLTEGDLLQAAGGFVGMAIAGGLLTALVLPAVRRRERVGMRVAAIAGVVIAGGLAVILSISSQVEVGAVCEGPGVSGAAAYDGGPGIHPVEAVHKGRRIWTAPEAAWRPGSTAETELVACVGPVERFVIETCPYSGGPTVTRYGYRRTVTLVAARSGEVLATESFAGDYPRACSQTEERSVRSLKGEKNIDADEVWAWLSAWVAPGAGAEAGEPTPLIIVTEPPMAEPVQEVEALTPEAEQAVPEATGIEVTGIEELPAAVVTPGLQPPETFVLRGAPVLYSGPDYEGEMMGSLIERGETVELLGSVEGWTLVRWVSPEGEEVRGWIQSLWVGTP